MCQIKLAACLSVFSRNHLSYRIICVCCRFLLAFTVNKDDRLSSILCVNVLRPGRCRQCAVSSSI